MAFPIFCGFVKLKSVDVPVHGIEAANTCKAQSGYLDAVENHEARIERLEKAILASSCPAWRLLPVVEALQVLRGVSMLSAVSLIAELGDLTRFDEKYRPNLFWSGQVFSIDRCSTISAFTVRTQMRGFGHADVWDILQVPGNKADASPL